MFLAPDRGKTGPFFSPRLSYQFGASYEYSVDAAFRPLPKLIASLLVGRSPGIYSVAIDYPRKLPDLERTFDTGAPVNPPVIEANPVTREFLAKTSQALVACQAYPKALPKVVGSVAAWRSSVESALWRVTAALQGASSLHSNNPASLALEEGCIWIGPDSERPSRRLGTASIQTWLAGGG